MSAYDPEYVSRLKGGAYPTEESEPRAEELAVRVKRNPMATEPMPDLGGIPRTPGSARLRVCWAAFIRS